MQHDQFYFELSGTFPIVKNNCLEHYVNVFNKNIFQIITNHLRYNKTMQAELNQKSYNFSDLICLFNNGLSLVTSKDSLTNSLNLFDSKFKTVKSLNRHTWPEKRKWLLTKDFLLLLNLFPVNGQVLTCSPVLTLTWRSVFH